MRPLGWLLTWGSGAAGAPVGGGGAESWAHPSASRPERVKRLGQRNQAGVFSGRVRADDDADLDTFFDE